MVIQSILINNEIKDLYEIPRFKNNEHEFLFIIDSQD